MSRSKVNNQIEHLLQSAGWSVQHHVGADLNPPLGVAVCDFPLARGYGGVDYLLCIEGRAAGLVEIGGEYGPLTGVPILSEKYSRGLPFSLRLFVRPLPFLYQSQGANICFTNAFDPQPAPRMLKGFHRPETLRRWLEDGMVGETPRDMAAEHFPEHRRRGRTFHERLLINMPTLVTDSLGPAQVRAMMNLEQSFKENCPRALLEMASEAERTAVALRFIERLLKFAEARRVLFLVNSMGMARKLLQTIQDLIPPAAGMSFAQAFPVQHLTENKIDPAARLCITTLPGLYERLAGQEGDRKVSVQNKASIQNKETALSALKYNADFPIETFDVVMLYTCNPWVPPCFRPVLTYFDAYLVGLTGKTDPAAADFFDQNLVMRVRDEGYQTEGLNVL